MNSILNNNLFLVKEHVGMFKASNNYDIHDPETGDIVLHCREENLSIFTKLFRFSDYKRMTPFNIEIRTPEGEKILTVRRGISLFLSKVEVLNEKDEVVGLFKQKFFSIGGKFNVLDPSEQVLCSLKGKWTSWDFRFVKENEEFATVTKKWSGLGKELFTTADNYVLQIDDKVPSDHPLRLLIMAAVMCIDMVLKE
ncbi:phospholipid scramblase-related protein [Limibacter armeniacum]|uniref:phospholipid scramblase-related protein n=1 Tax=Limibacter armeniacum TaxID=466084 RepID=UPI002FE67CF1